MNNPTPFIFLNIDPPYHLDGWVGLIILLAILAWGVKAVWEPLRSLSRRRWIILGTLAVATPLLALLWVIPLPIQDHFPLPGIPLQPRTPVIILLAALPWVLAGGFTTPFLAVLLGALSGLVVAHTESHHWFTLLELAGLALAFSFLVRQRYRTPVFRFWRHPLAAGLTLAIFYAPVYILTSFFATGGPVVARIDYALTQTWPWMLARAAELMLASLLAEALYLMRARDWGKGGHLMPSPVETSLQRRFFFTTAPLVLILVLALTIGDWVVAGNTARQMIQDRLKNLADIVSETLPPFLETGQTLVSNIGTPELLAMNSETLRYQLGERMRSVPFFSQLLLFDSNLNLIGGYPRDKADPPRLSDDEATGLRLALKNVTGQTYLVQPQMGERSVMVSFIALIKDAAGTSKGVIMGRTDLLANPITKAALQSVESLKPMQGEGMVLDEIQRVIYHTSGAGLLTGYDGYIPDSERFFDEPSKIGVRLIGYYRVVEPNSWGVLVQVPAEQAQSQALNIAVPLLVILVILSTLAFLALRLGLRQLTGSLKTLSNEATMIAQGKLDQPLQVTTVDEVGQTGRAFEQMRLSLKARLEELNNLLRVSQAVAANLEAGEAIRPILEAAMGDAATSARVILPQDVVQDLQFDRSIVLGYGPLSEQYAYLDMQIFELMRNQNLMSIPNTSRIRRLNFSPGCAMPGAVVALALQRENRYFGALWVAYEHPHNFSEEEIRFLGTLANQAALAASNARLFASAEVGRQRLEAVLVSSPEPVLVIDEKLRLLLLNSAAMQVPGLIINATPGEPIHNVINHPQLLELISHKRDEKITSIEISLQNDRVYFASVSLVTASNHLVGKVCVLQDITHYKHLDTLKSDFVQTVSHDLRSPLTLIRGYTTMLQMVGELNEQQKGYTTKIVAGVDSMTHLINNLLDLGWIESGMALRLEKVTAQDVIEQVLSALQPQAAQKNIHLSVENSTPQPVELDADRALLQQALTNLVENGIKYTPMGGAVKVSLVTRAETVVFEVHDTGIGVAPLDLPRIFEKFYRSRRREGFQLRGTGLGLAIVKSIAERHKGRVGVESQLGRGSLFYFEVPYRQSQP